MLQNSFLVSYVGSVALVPRRLIPRVLAIGGGPVYTVCAGSGVLAVTIHVRTNKSLVTAHQ